VPEDDIAPENTLLPTPETPVVPPPDDAAFAKSFVTCTAVNKL